MNLSSFPYKVIDYKLKMNLNDMADLKPKDIKYCVWHHEGAPKDTDSSAKQINDYHRNVKGWAGIGYHGVIRHNGNLELGRPLTKCGVHVGQPGNSQSIAFCITGNFSLVKLQEVRPIQFDAAVRLAVIVSLTYPGIKHVPHRDLHPSECPGKLFPWKEFIREHDILLNKEKSKNSILYCVQVGAFAIRDNALRLRDKFKAGPITFSTGEKMDLTDAFIIEKKPGS